MVVGYMVNGSYFYLCLSGNPMPTIKWYKDDKPFYATGMFHKKPKNGIKIGELTTSDQGKYTCEASNSFGQKLQYNMTLVITRK